jgi:hypothetical protein
MDNLEKLATYGAQNEEAIKNGQSRKTGNIWCFTLFVFVYV